MKKSLFFLVALSGLALVSCDSENDGYSSVTTYPIPAYNLFVANDGSEKPFVAPTNYNFTVKIPDLSVAVKAPSIALPDGSTTSFGTSELTPEQYYISMGEYKCEVLHFSAKNPVTDGSVTDFNCYLSQAAYSPVSNAVPDYNRFLPSNTAHFAVMNYNLNMKWNVRTFWPDCTFQGTTTTTYPHMEAPYSNDKMAYRIVMKREQTGNALTGKADVIFYNARFAEMMPELTIVIKDLDVEFDELGYTVKGENIIPYMMEAGLLQENPKYIFNKFEFSSVGDMTTGKATYKVANVFDGSFSGAWIQIKNK